MNKERIASWAAIAIGLLVIIWAVIPRSIGDDFDLDGLARTAVLDGGRIKPLDSVARNSLLIIGGKQTFIDQEGDKREAIEWLAQVVLHPEQAAHLRVFRIDHPDVTGIFGVSNEERKYFSFAEITPHWEQLRRQYELVNPEAQQRTPYEQALVKLVHAFNIYNGLSISVVPPSLLGQDPRQQYESLAALRERAVATAGQAQDESGEMSEGELAAAGFGLMQRLYSQLAQQAEMKVVPPPPQMQGDPDAWMNLGESGIFTLQTGIVDPVPVLYAELSAALQAGDAETFNAKVNELQQQIAQRHPGIEGDVSFEQFFNRTQPFLVSMTLYVLLFMAVVFSWLLNSRPLNKAAFWLLIFAVAVQSFGLLARMIIQDRPPVTNLYSSAVFIGWFSAVLALVLERLFRNGFAGAAAAVIGFCTLIIAQNLGTTGDTLEMMRAVLDSNFWLATHVITITMGYSATFLAGALAIAHIFGGRILSPKSLQSIERMAYGITCFALLFSFIGTVLGGIWADQSWGRFWGWDPKENGALMIVLWNALVLHARWGKLVSPTGLMQLIVFGNVITAWSWFGTNQLGVGLHAYGFTEKGAIALLFFVLSQILIMIAGVFLKPPHKARKNAQA